jgi:hypothetical protein
MIKREKERLPPDPAVGLNAIRFAIKAATFKLFFLSVSPKEMVAKISR